MRFTSMLMTISLGLVFSCATKQTDTTDVKADDVKTEKPDAVEAPVKHHKMDPAEHAAKLKEMINLTDEQTTQVEAIFRNTELKPNHAELQKILNEEQWTKFQEIIAKHHKHGGCDCGKEGGCPHAKDGKACECPKCKEGKAGECPHAKDGKECDCPKCKEGKAGECPHAKDGKACECAKCKAGKDCDCACKDGKECNCPKCKKHKK
ncbi:hypothetical protein ACFL6C_05660 [Myxococcota bacterium]